MKHAVEIQLSRVLLIPERRIGEIDVAVVPHDHIIWRVETLAFEARRDHIHFAVLGCARHAPLAKFTGVEIALLVVCVPGSAARTVADLGDALSRSELVLLVRDRIAEQQKIFERPYRSIREAHAVRHDFDGVLGRVLLRGLRPGNSGEKQCGKADHFTSSQARCDNTPAAFRAST